MGSLNSLIDTFWPFLIGAHQTSVEKLAKIFCWRPGLSGLRIERKFENPQSLHNHKGLICGSCPLQRSKRSKSLAKIYIFWLKTAGSTLKKGLVHGMHYSFSGDDCSFFVKSVGALPPDGFVGLSNINSLEKYAQSSFKVSFF